MSQTNPDDPPPQEEPTHDVPVYPEGDPPPAPEKAIQVAAGPGEDDVPDEGGVTRASHGQPREGMPRSAEPANAGPRDDVDEDDLDPQAPHSPPDIGKGRVIFDEDAVAR
jgi:hypothetical protein